MKYALVNNEKVEAFKGGRGLCPSCGAEVRARICTKKVSHWFHLNKEDCDTWSEPETEWHRSWKNYFPIEWQEITCTDPSTGEKHRADVLTEENWAIEVQHSPISRHEVASRNDFYKKIVWVINGARRTLDWKRFDSMLRQALPFGQSKIPTYAANPQFLCNLVDDWLDPNTFTFFDFQQQMNNQPIVWLLFPHKRKDDIIFSVFPKRELIHLHLTKQFDKFFTVDMPEIQEERSRRLGVYRRTKRVKF